MKRTNFTISRVYCVKCGNEGIPIPRTANRVREPGHLKKLYCVHCKKRFNHIEIRNHCGDYSYEDFLLEKENGNFDEKGNRKVPYRIFRGNMKNKAQK